jgi:hypothetical protein
MIAKSCEPRQDMRNRAVVSNEDFASLRRVSA